VVEEVTRAFDLFYAPLPVRPVLRPAAEG